MTKYHPETRFLTDYAAGSLPESQALCVAAHLHYCAACRKKVSALTQVGTEFFLSQEPEEVSEDCFNSIMAKLDASDEKSQIPLKNTETALQKDSKSQDLPQAIQKLTKGNIDSLSWRNIGKSFRFSDINLGDKNRETSLLHIKAGGNIPQHHHRGDEITIVLRGSFSDQEDHYHVGDFIVRTDGETHTPVASQNEDCLCLATLDAPIVMNNWLLRMLAPFFSKQSPAIH